MKILLKLRPCSPALAQRLASDPLLAKAMGPKPNAAVGFLFSKFFDAAGRALPRLLELAAGEPVSFLRDLAFSAAEVGSASHLEVVCKTTVAQSPADIKRTQAAYAADTLHATASRWAVRLPQQVYLTKEVPPNAICHVDQWTGEYVLGARAAAALQTSELSGYRLQPVLHPKPQAGEASGLHLVTNELLPAVREDATFFETWDDGPREPSTPRRYGLLAYGAESLESSPDFSRTAEPWGAWRTPQWVARQSVRGWFADAQLRGWDFWPVLLEGSPLHRAHGDGWHNLLATLEKVGAEISV
jgi:hypothetical protein